MLVLLVILNLKGFSQNVIGNNKDTTKVVLPIKVARLVYQDLLRYDGVREELRLTREKLSKVEERETKKDSIITLLGEKDKNNKLIILKKDEQLQISKELTDNLRKELRNQRTKTFLWKLGTFVGIATSTFLIFTN